jgi:uncharacterized Zn-binding protein involved in type VI secretion
LIWFLDLQDFYSSGTIGLSADVPAEPAPKLGPEVPILRVALSHLGGRAGRPAARLGDMTARGGVIATASEDVVIGGKPAARVADMHTCPMVDMGGPVLPAGSTTVRVNFRSAARLGDQCSCAGTGSLDVITGGEYTVLIG